MVFADSPPVFFIRVGPGGLSGAKVDRLRLKDVKLVERDKLVRGLGRVREVMAGPNGFVYIALNELDKVIRLVPAK
jgi:aldose sugar dehydrogenase